MSAVYLEHEFFGDERFGVAAELLNEHRFITEMRVIRCWRECYNNDKPNLSVREIRVNARWTGDPAQLIAALSETGIVDYREDGTYEFHGVAARLELLREKSAAGRAGGLASAKKRLKATKSDATGSVGAGQATVNGRSAPVDAGAPAVNDLPRPSNDRQPSDCLTDCLTVSKETTVATADAADDSRTRLPVRTLAKLWNEHRHPGMPEVDVAKLSSASPRYRFARQRLVEQPDLAYWRTVVERIAASSFCRGENNRGWRADFAFLVRAETHVKVLEGKYDDRDGGGGAAADAAKKAEAARRVAAIFAEAEPC